MDMHSPVDRFFSTAGKWQKEFLQLRAIVLDCHLTETLKWGQPCYMFGKSNIVLIHGFKDYCALLFFKGALLKDPKHILIRQTANVQAARQVRFTAVSEIVKIKSALKAYIYEAIRVEEAGLKVAYKKTSAFQVPQEFQSRLNKSAALKKAFQALTPGRQRAYIFYFSSAKQSATRASRVDKFVPKILAGKGMDD